MNTEQCMGMAKIAGGRLQEAAGLILFNRHMQRRGFEMRIAGEAQKAIGNAHRVLRAYRRRCAEPADHAPAYPAGLSPVKE